MILFETPKSIPAGRRFVSWAFLIESIGLATLLRFVLDEKHAKAALVIAISLLLMPLVVRGLEVNGKIKENTYLNILLKNTYLAGIFTAPPVFFSDNLLTFISFMVGWIMTGVACFGGELFGELEPNKAFDGAKPADTRATSERAEPSEPAAPHESPNT